MNIPTFINVKYCEDSGYLTVGMQYYNDQLNQVLRLNLSDDGFVIPSRESSEIVTLEPEMPAGTLWFNSTISKLQVKTADGVIETITSTP